MKRKLLYLLTGALLIVGMSGCGSTDVVETNANTSDVNVSTDASVESAEIEVTLQPKEYEGTLPDDWKEMTIAFEGHEVKVGETPACFVGNLGWVENEMFVFNGPFFEDTLEANQYANVMGVFNYKEYDNTNQNDLIRLVIDVMNDTNEKVSFKDAKMYHFECHIADIMGEFRDAYPNVIFSKGITWGSSYKEIIAAYGEYDTEGMTDSYIWYIKDESGERVLNQYMSLEINKETGLVGFEISYLPQNMEVKSYE